MNVRKLEIFGWVFAVVVLTAAANSSVFGHTYHSTLARMDYNAESKSIEVSMQLFVHDVVPLLEKRLKKRVDLETTKEVDGVLEKYIGEHFVVYDSGDVASGLKWVGKEVENDVVHVYFEIPFSGALDNAKLRNTVLFETFPTQTNLVVVRSGEFKSNLTFKSGDKIKPFANQ